MAEGDAPILILGGTGEARDLAARLDADGIAMLSSLAGRVRDPRLPVGPVRIGGFGGIDGMRDWLSTHRIRGIVDATHPFAAGITANAAAVAAELGLPLLRLRRPPWSPDDAVQWIRVPDMDAAAVEVARRGTRVMVTTGRQDVGVFAANASAWFLIRVVDPPEGPLPPHHEILRSRGPYEVMGEWKILRENQIDLLVTKNSGGLLTRAKLDAAAELGITVVMVDRPAEPAVGTAVGSVDDAVDWVRALG